MKKLKFKIGNKVWTYGFCSEVYCGHITDIELNGTVTIRKYGKPKDWKGLCSIDDIFKTKAELENYLKALKYAAS